MDDLMPTQLDPASNDKAVRDTVAISLRAKLIIVFIVITLVPIAVVGSYSDGVARNLINQDARQNLSETSTQTALQIDAYIYSQLNSIRTEAQQPFLNEYLELSPGQRLGSSQEFNARQILIIFSRKDPVFIKSYALLDDHGMNLLDTSEEYIGRDESDFNYFYEPMSNGLPFASTVLFQDQASVYISAAVRNEIGETLGVLRAEYDAVVFQSIVLSLLPETITGEFLMLVDKTSYVRIADSKSGENLYKSLKNLPAEEILLLQTEKRLLPGLPEEVLAPSDPFVAGIDNLSKSPFFTAYSDSLKTDALITGVPLQNVPWIVFNGRSLNILAGPVQEQRRATVLLALLILSGATILALLAAQVITRPLTNLTAVAKKIAAGDLQAQVVENSRDEIGVLAVSFNTMTEKLRQTLKGLEEELLERRQIERERENLILELETKNEESETLRESLASIVGKLEFNEIIEHILDQIMRVVPYDSASIWRVEDQLQKFVAGRNVPPEIIAQGVEYVINRENSAYPIIIDELPYILNLDVQAQLKDFQQEPHTYVQSWLAIPLKTRGQIIGVIALDGKEKNQFNEHHAELAVTFANQVAIALENSRLFSELQSELMERKKAEEVMLRFRRVMDESNDSIFMIDPHTSRYLDFNKSAYENLGYSQKELSDLGVINIAQHITSIEIWDERVELIREKGGLIFESSYRRKDGTTFPVEVSARMLDYGDKTIMVAVVRDITERKQAEAELRQSEQNYRTLYGMAQKQTQELALLGNVRNAMAQELDLSALLRSVVEAIADSFGYALTSLYLLEEDMLVLQHQVGYERVISKFPLTTGVSGRVVQTGKPVFLEDVQTDPNFLGAIENIVSEICVPLFDSGRVAGVLNVESTKGMKLTEADLKLLTALSEHIGIAIGRARLYSDVQNELKARKQAEVNLRQRESILEVVADAANLFLQSSDWRLEIDLILERLGKTINASHAYLFENHSSEDGVKLASMLFEWTAPGYPSDLEDPLYTNSPLREEDLETWYANMMKRLPYIGDEKHLDKPDMDYLLERDMKALLEVPIYVDGKWWGTIGFDDMANAREWSNAEVDALVVAGNILGAAIQRQKADAKLQEELTQRKQLIAELATKNAELERFTYTVSHDLKSPLFTIRGFLGYLEQDALSGDQERIKKDTRRIADATDKMQQLLNDLLELSRIGRLMNESREVRFEELIYEVLELVHGQIEERGVNVQVQNNLPDVYGDRQRLSEVMQNLIDNAVKFMGNQPEPRIEIGQAGEDAERGMAVFFVRDNGVGIQQEHFERVFGLFNKLNPQSEGTGIGLALVKRIVEIHGGRIWVQSEAGNGTTFFFTLPLSGTMPTQPSPDSVI